MRNPTYEECHKPNDLWFDQPREEITISVFHRKDLSTKIDEYRDKPKSASFYRGGMVNYKHGGHPLQYNEEKGYFIVLLG